MCFIAVLERFEKNERPTQERHASEMCAPFPVPVAEPDPLCYECVYAHIVRGTKPDEETIACDYVFTLRLLRFRVRECTTTDRSVNAIARE